MNDNIYDNLDNFKISNDTKTQNLGDQDYEQTFNREATVVNNDEYDEYTFGQNPNVTGSNETIAPMSTYRNLNIP